MQYLSKVVVDPNKLPSVLFYDNKDNISLAQPIEDVIVNARSCLGSGLQLNPIRGQNGARYYHTFLRYTLGGTARVTSLLAAARTIASKSLYTSDGTATTFPSVGIDGDGNADTPYTLNNIILNPKGVTGFRMPNLTFKAGADNRFGVYYYASDSTSEIVQPTSTSAGTNNIYIYQGLTKETKFIQFPLRTYVQSIHFYIDYFYGTGLVYTDVTPGTNDVVNLDWAIGLMTAGNKCIRYTKDRDYTIASNLVPGNRPRVTFNTPEEYVTQLDL